MLGFFPCGSQAVFPLTQECPSAPRLANPPALVDCIVFGVTAKGSASGGCLRDAILEAALRLHRHIGTSNLADTACNQLTLEGIQALKGAIEDCVEWNRNGC